MRIHSYPRRMVRNFEFENNEAIQIITIICTTAKKQGKQYTRRLLPDFLMPGCVIRLDKALEAYRSEGGTPDINQACAIMNCIDDRTAIKHLHRLDEAIRQANLVLAETIALSPETGEFPQLPPEGLPLAVLTCLHDCLARARLRSGAVTSAPSILFFIQQIQWKIFSHPPSACAVTKQHPP